MLRTKKFVAEELLIKPSAVAPMLFVGLGGCGCRMVARVARHLRRRPDWQERYQDLIKFALVDTNINDLETWRELSDENLLISDFEKEQYANLASGKLFLEADEYFTQWVPQDYRFRAGDTAGAGQIRIESRLGIFYQMKHKDFVPRFRRLLEDLKSHEHGHRRLDSPEIRIVLCYSVAGGTGSGCHLPLAYVLRDLAQELGKPRLFGVAVLPAVFEDKTKVNKDGTFANGYAALKETEYLMKLGAPDSRFYPETGRDFHYNPLDESKTTVRQRPFEFIYLVDKPQSFTVENPIDAAADGLYLQFFSPLYGSQASDYDNYTQHQRFLVPHDFEGKGIEGFTTFYGSYGAAVLLVPVEGLVEYCSQATALSLMQESFLRGIPADPVYQALRQTRDPFDQVTLEDDENAQPVHVSEFHKKEPADRDRLRDRLFAKRVRLLAACEADAGEEGGRFLNLFRHGHRLGERPLRNGSYEPRDSTAPARERLEKDRTRLIQGGMEYSIGALVMDAVAGQRPGEQPGLLREAEKAIDSVLETQAEYALQGLGRAYVQDYKNRGTPLLEDVYLRALDKLKNGYRYGTLEFPGMGSLEDLDFLRHGAGAVDLVAKRYAVLRILEEVNWQQKPPEVPPGLELPDWNEQDKIKEKDAGGLIDDVKAEVRELARKKIQVEFLRRLGNFHRSLRSFAEVQRNLDEGFEDLYQEQERRLRRLREEGDESANQYILDAEALQIEDGRRMWDFYYHDDVEGKVEELRLKHPRVQTVLSDTVTDLSLSGRSRSQTGVLDKLFTNLRAYAQTVLQTHIGGDVHAADEHLQDGLNLAEALELEVVYRALYRSHAQEVSRKGSRAVRRILAEFRSLPPERQKEEIDLANERHQDYLRDKLRRVVKEKASVLCVYDDSRDQHGGVRPDQVFLAAIDQDLRESTVGEILRNADIADLQWVTAGWHDPKEIIFYRAILNVPLYVFGRMDDMKNHYYRFKNLAKRSKVLHIDKNWEDKLPDLDPDSSQAAHREKLVARQIISFAALLTTRREAEGHTCVVRREGRYWLLEPGNGQATGNGSSATGTDRDGRAPLGESLTEAIQELPEALNRQKVKYMSYQQMLHAVNEGLAPEVLRRVCQLPFRWRRNRDELRNRYGSNPGPVQEERLQDYTDSFRLLQGSLEQLLEKLRNREIEQRTLGEEAVAFHTDLPEELGDGTGDALRTNLAQSIEILSTFREAWKRMEDPMGSNEIPSNFVELFQPLKPEVLQQVLHDLREGFRGNGSSQAEDDAK